MCPTAATTPPPRYSQRPFPPYRYRPGAGLPHPRMDPAGHSHGTDDEYLPPFTPEDWASCEPYLYGIDLFNQGYWWEAHEALESVWLAAGQRATGCGIFVQGLIQLAGAQLKRSSGEALGARSLTAAACEKMAACEGICLGIAVAELLDAAQRCLREDRGEFPLIRLLYPPPAEHGPSALC